MTGEFEYPMTHGGSGYKIRSRERGKYEKHSSTSEVLEAALHTKRADADADTIVARGSKMRGSNGAIRMRGDREMQVDLRPVYYACTHPW